MKVKCNKAPVGWQCARAEGHEGPCSAVRVYACEVSPDAGEPPRPVAPTPAEQAFQNFEAGPLDAVSRKAVFMAGWKERSVEAQRVEAGIMGNCGPCAACAEALFCGSTAHKHEGCDRAKLLEADALIAELVAAFGEISERDWFKDPNESNYKDVVCSLDSVAVRNVLKLAARWKPTPQLTIEIMERNPAA